MRGLGFLLALFALVTVACGGDARTEEADPPPAAPGASDRLPAPPIEGVTLDGERIALSDFRGKPVFVNVWSSW